MRIVGVMFNDGERFVRPGSRKADHVHALLFDDGTMWDTYDGYLPGKTDWVKRFPWLVCSADGGVDGTGWAEAAFVDDVDPSHRTPGMRPRTSGWL